MEQVSYGPPMYDMILPGQLRNSPLRVLTMTIHDCVRLFGILYQIRTRGQIKGPEGKASLRMVLEYFFFYTMVSLNAARAK